jgi:hypothetical protein
MLEGSDSLLNTDSVLSNISGRHEALGRCSVIG